MNRVPHFLSPEFLISTFGLLGIVVIVFAESGLLFGFFLPGDSLLFTAGLLVANDEYLHQPLWLVCALVVAAAVAGDQVGYVFGRRVGPALFRRPNSRLFKRENLDKGRAVFERYGPRSIVLTRFVSVIRTFVPIVAGATGMRYRTFVVYNVVGGVAWGVGVPVLGYFLGQVGFIRDNVEAVIVVLVVLAASPIGVELVRARLRRSRRPAAAEDEKPVAATRS